MRIGIDLGGTKTEGVLMNRTGEIIERVRKPTPASEGYQAILNNLVQIIAELEENVGQSCRIGIGTPGSISTTTGLLRNSNTTCLNHQPLKQDLEKLLAREIRIANDANCFALSEAIDGAGKNAGSVFGIILGTGVGGGIVIDKKLHQGAQGIAGEWGHNVLDTKGPDCYCGRKGCIETYLSGPGLQSAFHQAGGLTSMDAPAIVTAAESGDDMAGEIFDRYIDRFGQALAMMINILDPHTIVLGGGMSNIAALYDAGITAVSRYVFNDELLTQIVCNRHGDSGGVRGAAWLWNAGE